MPASEFKCDAVVIGSGPNGFAAAITLAQHGLSVTVVEAQSTIGGGARSAELTLPGFVHDICSAIHPMALASPFFRKLPLHEHGLKWIHSPAAFAHPFDNEPAACVMRSFADTTANLGCDAKSYERHFLPFVHSADHIFEDLLAPAHFPRHPLLDLKFGFSAVRSAWALAHRWFRTSRVRGLFAGAAAHSILPLKQAPSAAVGLMLLLAAHACGWPLPQGGAQKISDALAAHFRSLGGQIITARPITNIDELNAARVVLLDLTPKQVLTVSGQQLSGKYKRALNRYRYGPGVFKVDWALSHPIPWNDPACSEAATVHVGGTIDEIERSESAAWTGGIVERPFVLVTQPSLFDSSRTSSGQHTAWGYCHVPHASSCDMLAQIESQMERFAAGFRDCILARHVLTPMKLEQHNSNCVGGDVTGGVQDFRQLLTRPVMRWNPYRTSARRIYICSSSTPPGGGVHGMCGYFAARTAIRDHFR